MTHTMRGRKMRWILLGAALTLTGLLAWRWANRPVFEVAA